MPFANALQETCDGHGTLAPLGVTTLDACLRLCGRPKTAGKEVIRETAESSDLLAGHSGCCITLYPRATPLSAQIAERMCIKIYATKL